MPENLGPLASRISPNVARAMGELAAMQGAYPDEKTAILGNGSLGTATNEEDIVMLEEPALGLMGAVDPSSDLPDALATHSDVGLPLFDRLYTRYREPLRRHIARLTGDEVGAEDIAQETFIKLIRLLGSEAAVGRTSTLPAWLFRVATNAVLEKRRQNARRPIAYLSAPANDDHHEVHGVDDPTSSLEEALVDPYSSPDEQVAARDELSNILDAMKLPYAECLLLREYLGYSEEEMALLLNLSVLGARTRLRRARAKAYEAGVRFAARGMGDDVDVAFAALLRPRRPKIDDDAAECLRLHENEGLSQEHIARKLNLSVRSVQIRLTRARALMQNASADSQDDAPSDPADWA